MQQQSNAIEQFRQFSQQAVTRCGVPFKCRAFQVTQSGEPTSIKGEVYVKGERGEDIPMEMVWNLEGQAMLVGNVYDLVREIPFDAAPGQGASNT